MEQALLFFKTQDPLEERDQRVELLNRLSLKKISWEYFLTKAGDLVSISRLVVAHNGRSLLHLAVLDNRLDVIEALKGEPSLKNRRDGFGLTPIELAQLLDYKEALRLLRPLSEVFPFPKLPEWKDFEYLSHPIFETKEGLEKVLASIAKAKREDKIPSEKIWMGIYFDKEIRKGGHPPISIRQVNQEVGYGVFAEKKISPCTYVGEYTGVIQQRSVKELEEKRHCLHYPVWEGKKNFAMDAEKRGNFTRFINHSSNPNLCLQSVYWWGISRMIFVTLKEIREGGQLTFDYGYPFWKNIRQTPQVL